MTISRRLLLTRATAAASVCAFPMVRAAGYPERPVRIVIPFAAGAGTDAVGRLMAQKMGERLGKCALLFGPLQAGALTIH